MRTKILCFLIQLVLVNLAFCDPASVLKQIDQQTLLKQTDTQQKNQLLTSLSQEADILKQAYAAVVQSSTAAESTYTSYFNEQARCEGLNPQFDFVGDVSALPEDFCLVAPVGSAAIDVYTKSLQLLDLQYNASLNSKLVDQQTMFNADYFQQQKAYNNLATASFTPLQAAVKALKDCIQNYATPANPNPIQCKSLNNTLNKAVQVYQNYHQLAFSFGRLAKLPMFDLQRLQNAQSNLTAAVNALTTTLQPLIAALKKQYFTCIANLENIKLTTNAALASALTSRNRVNDQNYQLNQLYATIAANIAKIKADTATLKTLAANLKTYYP